jgi:hypothetical protein
VTAELLVALAEAAAVVIVGLVMVVRFAPLAERGTR